MEVYILDSLYRRSIVADRFESFIWTERHRAYGDFELHLQSTFENRSRFTAGTNIGMNESYRVMTVETVEDSIDANGKATLKVTGRSLERILDDRVARGVLGDTTATPKWTLTGTPTTIARQIFHDICVTGILDSADVIAGITEGSSIFPEDTIAEPSDSIVIDLDPTTVYQAIKAISDVYDTGFRVVKTDTGLLYFDIYTGSDRTTQQTALAAVVFSPDLGNLQNTTDLKTIAGFKNVAYVFSPVGHEIVYPLDVDPSTTGFDRHVLLVKADDIKDTDPTLASTKMIQRGNEELAKNRNFSGFDGEINQNNQYKYGVDYNLGDLIELRNTDGATDQMQVTEQIFVSDSEGDRSYPTLTINKFITPGSWSAWDYNQVWNDLDSDPTTWVDQP